jgi:hypothetical protein
MEIVGYIDILIALGAESNLSVFENFDQEAVSYFKDVIKE